MDFYLGTDVTGLSWQVPVMVSYGRLRNRQALPAATAPWVCDSRGFSELSQYGTWTIDPYDYADALTRYSARIGQLVWAAPQDWMCEPQILAKTGKTITEHQRLTVDSVLLLRSLTPTHVIPVLQGWRLSDYLRHVAMYADRGIDLAAERVVGLGSVCRRQASKQIIDLVGALEALGLRLHGFGVKTDGIDAYGPLLASADSWAWSYGARRRIGLCPHGEVVWEANCCQHALAWRSAVLARLGSAQPSLNVYASTGGW